MPWGCPRSGGVVVRGGEATSVNTLCLKRWLLQSLAASSSSLGKQSFSSLRDGQIAAIWFLVSHWLWRPLPGNSSPGEFLRSRPFPLVGVGTTQISAVLCCNYNYVRQIVFPTPLGTATATSATHGDFQATIAGKHRITPKLIKRKLNKLQYKPTKGGPNSQAFRPFCKAQIKEKKQLGQHEILGEETAQEEEKDPDQRHAGECPRQLCRPSGRQTARNHPRLFPNAGDPIFLSGKGKLVALIW
jgi:hypothetical protein